MESNFSSKDSLNGSVAQLNTKSLTEITAQFFAGCHMGVASGSLCHSSWFTLQHSMSAIEIMDPKMDIRMHGARRVTSVAEALATKSLPLGPFSNSSELIGIMDEMLASTVNWLTGDSLAQTIFICMYMHCTQQIQDNHLACFCELLRRTVRQLRHVIIAAGVFDEEDHYAPTHGMPLTGPNSLYTDSTNGCHEFSRYSNSELMDYSLQLIRSLTAADAQGDPTQTELQQSLCVRLKFVRTLFHLAERLFVHVDSVDAELKTFEWELFAPVYGGQSAPDVKEEKVHSSDHCSINSFWKTLALLCSEYGAIFLELHNLSKQLTATLSSGLPSGKGRLTPKDADYGLPGFEPFLNQTKLPSCIPRFVIIHDRSDAFSYFTNLTSQLTRITSEFQTLASWHQENQQATTLHLLWCLMRANGQKPCQFLHDLLNCHKNKSESKELNLSSCVISRTITCLLYFVSAGKFKSIDSQVDACCSIQLDFAVQSWLLLEPKKYRPLILDLIKELTGVKNFFELVAGQLSLISRLYCFNRSRQRSALYQFLTKFPDLLEESMNIEWVIGVNLAERLGLSNTHSIVQDGQSYTPQVPVVCLPLQLTNQLCYYYYQLAWDFIVSGFQLELYASHEWVLIYTFIIQLFQNFSCLLGRFATLREIVEKEEVTHPVPCTDSPSQDKLEVHMGKSNDLESQSPQHRVIPQNCSGAPNRRKNRKKKSKRTSAKKSTVSVSNETGLNDEESEKTVPACLKLFGIGSELELLVLTCHQFLTAATVYAIRALQLDSGGDPILDWDMKYDCSSTGQQVGANYINALGTYGRRLGLFILPASSPLVDLGGIAGAFSSCKRYLTSGVFNKSMTTELYALAARNFENARFRIQMARTQQETESKSFAASGHVRAEGLTVQAFGFSDDLGKLDRLAHHNAIASRVLSKCPDRRPRTGQPTSLDSTHNLSPKCPSYLLASSPVRLEFDFLSTRSYPLICLINPSQPPKMEKS